MFGLGGYLANVPGGVIAPSRVNKEELVRQLRGFNDSLQDPAIQEKALQSLYAPSVQPPAYAPQPQPQMQLPPAQGPSRVGLGGAADIINRQQQSNQQLIDEQREVSRQAAEAMQQGIAEQERDREQYNILQEENRQRMIEDRNKYDELSRRAEEAEKINPARALEGWRGIMAAVSIGLGAASSAISGQPNPALELINRAVDRDIEAQKAQAQGIKTAADMHSNAYIMAKNIYGSDEGAYNAMSIHKKEQLINKLKVYQEKMPASEMRQKLETEITNLQMDALKQAQQLSLQNRQLEEQRRSNMATENIQRAKANNFGGRELSASEVERIANLNSLDNIISNVEKEKSTKGSSTGANILGSIYSNLPWPTQANQYNDIHTQSAIMLGTAIENRGLTGEDIKLYKSFLPTVGDSAERSKVKIDNLRNLVRDKRKNIYEGLKDSGFNLGKNEIYSFLGPKVPQGSNYDK